MSVFFEDSPRIPLKAACEKNDVAMLNTGATYRSYNRPEKGTDPRVYAGKRTIVVYYLGPEVTN